MAHKKPSEALMQLEDAREMIDILVAMPEKELWNFILTAGIDSLDPNFKAQLITWLTFRLRAVMGIKDTFEIDMPTDEEIAEGYGCTVEEIKQMRAAFREKA